MKLFFRTIGEGKPVIILHGLFGLNDNWQTFAKAVADKGFKAILVDLRNHGQSPHSSEFNYEVMSGDVIELIQSENIINSILLGHSLGGKVAMKVALQNPDFISKLIVVDIAPKYYPVHHDDVLKALHAVNLNETKTRADAEKILSNYLHDTGTRQFLLKNLYWVGEKLAWRFNLDSISNNIENVGEEITYPTPLTKPTLFIRGQKSRYVSDNDFSSIQQLFPQAKLETINNAGHWVHADNLMDMMAVCTKFMEEK